MRSGGAWWLGLVGHGCRQALDVRLRLSVQAQQARQVVCRVGWNGRARLALPLAVRYPQQRRAFAGFFNVDLVGAVGVVRRIARAVITVFPAQLESAAPGLALVQAGLACAHPELAYPQAVFFAVPPVVVALGEQGRGREGREARGGDFFMQGRPQRVVRACLGGAFAHIVQHPAPRLLAGPLGGGVCAIFIAQRQRGPCTGNALLIGAVEHHQPWCAARAAGTGHHRVLPAVALEQALEPAPPAAQPALRGLGAVHPQVKVPLFPYGDENAVLPRIAVAVYMFAAQRKVGLPKPAFGRELLGCDQG